LQQTSLQVLIGKFYIGSPSHCRSSLRQPAASVFISPC